MPDTMKDASIKLAAWNHMLRTSTDVFYVKDVNGAYVDASKSFAALQGIATPAEIIGLKDTDFVTDPKALATCQRTDRLVLEEGQSLHTKPHKVVDSKSVPQYFVSDISPLYDEAGNIIGIFGVLYDVTSKVITAHERDLLAQAVDQDSMTGLLNHAAAMRRMRAFLQGPGAAGTHALFMIDADDFKNVNDTLGHQMGDAVIVRFAKAIKASFRDFDIVSRMGGDEFAVLMVNIPSRDIVMEKAHRLSESLSFRYGHDGRFIDLTASIGISLYQGDAEPLEGLYSVADEQMYQSKQHGNGGFSLAG